MRTTFESGMIWAPDQKFAEEVIEECAAFPFGDVTTLRFYYTNYVRFRRGGLLQHEDYVMENNSNKKGIVINPVIRRFVIK